MQRGQAPDHLSAQTYYHILLSNVLPCITIFGTCSVLCGVRCTAGTLGVMDEIHCDWGYRDASYVLHCLVK